MARAALFLSSPAMSRHVSGEIVTVAGGMEGRTLWDSAQRLKGSKMAREWFGDAFVEHFAATREWEEREFRKHISDWELARYFEII